MQDDILPGEEIRLGLTFFPVEMRLPDTSVRRDEEGAYIFLVEGDTLVRKDLASSRTLDVSASMLDQQVVVLGPRELRPGQRVQAVPLKQTV